MKIFRRMQRNNSSNININMKTGLNKNIFTNRTMLRKYIASDKKIFGELFTDREVNKYMGGQHCETPEDAFSLFDKCFEIYNGSLQDRHFEIWGIEFEGNLIGHFELKQTQNTVGNELEVVYLLNKEYWGRGLMLEVLNQVNSYSSGMGKQLIATINPENINTVKLLKKTGIEREGWIEDDEGKVYKIWLTQLR
ncbi:MAG: GNAT family N-acetyltransferase [Ignavibacteria bacterium]|nr:GNAT family N-acetyltransferase [Ignavibacteria bacterium]